MGTFKLQFAHPTMYIQCPPPQKRTPRDNVELLAGLSQPCSETLVLTDGLIFLP